MAACREECDDGNTVNGDGCDATCRREFCGDAIVQGGLGEQCDDGNRNPFDGCTNDCIACGDGIRTPPEECDDGNTSSGDDCDAQCRLPRVVGTGTPQSCTEEELTAALAERSVTFDCGPDPVTITLTSEQAITAATTIDGGGRITLSGGEAVRILRVDASGALEVRNLTIADGRGESGGGILNSGTLTLTNCTLSGNSASGGIGGGILSLDTRERVRVRATRLIMLDGTNVWPLARPAFIALTSLLSRWERKRFAVIVSPRQKSERSLHGY